MVKLITTKDANPNYLAKICKIEKIEPILDSAHLSKTIINGYTMVVSNDFKEGDIVIYFPVETVICEQFLRNNNLYEMGEYLRNANSDEVGKLLLFAEDELKNGNKEKANDLKAQAKSKVGFFNKTGRVRIIKLRGVYSEGFIAKIDNLVSFDSTLADTNWNELVGTSFNQINDTLFCWKYIPLKDRVINENNKNTQHFWKKRMKKLKKFDRIIPGTFKFHYDTVKLNDTIYTLNPDDIVTISVKVHGTSVVLSNIKVLRKLNLFEKLAKKIGFKVKLYEYANIFSSRSVIKNRYINPNGNSFYNSDVWGIANKVFAPYVDEDMTIYGEIVGYEEGTAKMIQKDHDYGCKAGEWKFMPYRITSIMPNGEIREWNLTEVDEWARKLVLNHPELESHVLFLNILYHGKLRDLYPDIEIDEYWHENLLERLKNDKEHFLMEEKEPMCHLYELEAKNAKNALDDAIANCADKKIVKALQKSYDELNNKRAPREGIVIRIDDDIKPRAWKLKTNAHYHRECIQHDNGEIDIEENA